MKTIKFGYTMLELMATMAVIGTLAAVSIPSYTDYLKRAKVASGISLATKAKSAVSEYYQYENSFPSSNTMAGIGLPDSLSDENVSSVEISDGGIITITYNPSANGGIGNMALTLTLTPTGGADAITWIGGSSGDNGVPQQWCPHTITCLGSGS